MVDDAGGFTKPTMGEGIFYSAGRLDEEKLSGYETRWQGWLGQELRIADWLRDRADMHRP